MKVDKQNRVRIPQRIQEAYGIYPGTEVNFREYEGYVILNTKAICAFCGATVDLYQVHQRFICGLCREELMEMREHPYIF